MKRALVHHWVAPMLLFWCVAGDARADVRFFVYDLTTSTKFTEVYLAPSGSGQWGANQTLNDKDRVLDPGERLGLSAGARGIYDVKFIDRDGRVCIKSGIDLTRETSFDIRDIDLASCLAGDKGKRRSAAMIVSVLYKVDAGGKFDLDYYLASHIPLVRKLWGPVGLNSVQVLKGSGTAGGGAAEISFIALLDFASMAAFEDAARLHGQEIIGDIANFTDSNPTIQFNEVIG